MMDYNVLYVSFDGITFFPYIFIVELFLTRLILLLKKPIEGL